MESLTEFSSKFQVSSSKPRGVNPGAFLATNLHELALIFLGWWLVAGGWWLVARGAG